MKLGPGGEAEPLHTYFPGSMLNLAGFSVTVSWLGGPWGVRRSVMLNLSARSPAVMMISPSSTATEPDALTPTTIQGTTSSLRSDELLTQYSTRWNAVTNATPKPGTSFQKSKLRCFAQRRVTAFK